MTKGSALTHSSAAVRRGEELCDAVATNKLIVAKAFYEIGTALLELEKKQLWKALGHESFAAMLEERDLVGRSQAYKFMRVARSFAPHVARQLGVEKSDAIVRYAEATAKLDDASTILERGIAIDGEVQPIEKLSARDILREVRRTRQNRENARRDPARKSALALSHAAARSLSLALGETVKAKPHRRGTRWDVALTLSVAGMEELQRLVAQASRGRR